MYDCNHFLSRRVAFKAISSIAAYAALQKLAIASTRPIRIGRLAVLQGSFGWGQIESFKGVQAAISEANAQGGVLGRPIEIISAETNVSGNETEKLARKMIEMDQVLCFIGGDFLTVGTLIPTLTETGVPLIAPMTGLDSLRKHNPMVFWTRPSYGGEIAKISEHIKLLGQHRCAVLFSDNSFGKAALAAFESSAKAVGIVDWKAFVMPERSEQLDVWTESIIAWSPTSLIALMAGSIAIEAFKKVRKKISVPAYNYSGAGSKPVLDALGEQAKGTIVSQVVPNPNSVNIKLVRDYNQALKKIPGTQPSYTSLEGYVGARVLIEGLRRSGGTDDREKFVKTLNNMRAFDLGGFDIGYTSEDHTGSRFVALSYYNGEKFRQ